MLGVGYMGVLSDKMDQSFLGGTLGSKHNALFSGGGSKRTNKYMHGTPGNFPSHFSHNGSNLHNKLKLGSNGKVMANHNMNSK